MEDLAKFTTKLFMLDVSEVYFLPRDHHRFSIEYPRISPDNSMYIRLLMIFLSAFVLFQSTTSDVLGDVVLYDNGVTNIDSPYWSDLGNGQLLADEFSFADDALLTSISWSGVYGGIDPVETDFFEIKVLQDVDPTDGVRFLTLHSIQTSDVNRVDSGTNFGSLDIYNYNVDISDLEIELEGNEVFWLSIFNETPVSSGGNAGWAWSAQDNDEIMAYTNPSTPWTVLTGATDCQLSGNFTAVPEPSGLLLPLSGLVYLVLRRRDELAKSLR